MSSLLVDVQSRIAAATLQADRALEAVRLVAVSKTKPADEIRTVLIEGQRLFGENRVQEAEAKWPELRAEFPDAKVHLIGPLQTNKVKQAVALFDVIETVDRPKLARALATEMQRSDRYLDCLVQINVGEEDQKAGIAPGEADQFIALCRNELKLPVIGLMCIPPADEEPAPYFALLAKIAARNDLAEISMGMSSDFEVAIQFGATMVRVGTAIFGTRS
ncbi:MAG: YggS family pyridoxal phosphate-dependent enzyme [Alphaproteobacteria bacterium]|jgi:PLP dependent protein|nr:YggS family pyridoxal phosphate-dependent enzyme [Alphaproteobacteria bacterium]MBT4016580.1 YggS family pyridoxal phosphate-dependent enzyme [Alphaproteobacteria bacterium]MBT5159148.1 YggS family pyridoxal phosphate-dependent enzyme [Alphaproteobacteria bacterium]MBT5917692.1 YggS family pyridoxal phosphate-dependent enzyme [Alphaproteobacteria bacterium]